MILTGDLTRNYGNLGKLDMNGGKYCEPYKMHVQTATLQKEPHGLSNSMIGKSIEKWFKSDRQN